MPRKELELDLGQLNKSLREKSSKGRIPLKEALASIRFAKIGINLFRDVVENCIWKIQKGEDGLEYIARTEPEGLISESSNDDWAANADASKENVTISFRGMPLCKFANKDYGFDKNTIDAFQHYILDKTQDIKFVRSLIAFATNKCPDCGGKPVYIGMDGVLCNTPGCVVRSVSAQRVYKPHDTLFFGKEEKGIPFYANNVYQGDLNLDKAREYEMQGIIELQQTPQGMIAKKK